MTTIGIVACSKTKLARPAPARDLYTSPLFRAARDYCEATYDRWFILSALHGLVDPRQVIEPYDVTLATLPAAERRRWRHVVIAQAAAHGWRLDIGPTVDRSRPLFFLHAGARYREPFSCDGTVVPLAGLGIGQQLAWYATWRAERQQTQGAKA